MDAASSVTDAMEKNMTKQDISVSGVEGLLYRKGCIEKRPQRSESMKHVDFCGQNFSASGESNCQSSETGSGGRCVW